MNEEVDITLDFPPPAHASVQWWHAKNFYQNLKKKRIHKIYFKIFDETIVRVFNSDSSFIEI